MANYKSNKVIQDFDDYRDSTNNDNDDDELSDESILDGTHYLPSGTPDPFSTLRQIHDLADLQALLAGPRGPQLMKEFKGLMRRNDVLEERMGGSDVANIAQAQETRTSRSLDLAEKGPEPARNEVSMVRFSSLSDRRNDLILSELFSEALTALKSPKASIARPLGYVETLESKVEELKLLIETKDQEKLKLQDRCIALSKDFATAEWQSAREMERLQKRLYRTSRSSGVRDVQAACDKQESENIKLDGKLRGLENDLRTARRSLKRASKPYGRLDVVLARRKPLSQRADANLGKLHRELQFSDRVYKRRLFEAERKRHVEEQDIWSAEQYNSAKNSNFGTANTPISNLLSKFFQSQQEIEQLHKAISRDNEEGIASPGQHTAPNSLAKGHSAVLSKIRELEGRKKELSTKILGGESQLLRPLRENRNEGQPAYARSQGQIPAAVQRAIDDLESAARSDLLNKVQTSLTEPSYQCFTRRQTCEGTEPIVLQTKLHQAQQEAQDCQLSQLQAKKETAVQDSARKAEQTAFAKALDEAPLSQSRTIESQRQELYRKNGAINNKNQRLREAHVTIRALTKKVADVRERHTSQDPCEEDASSNLNDANASQVQQLELEAATLTVALHNSEFDAKQLGDENRILRQQIEENKVQIRRICEAGEKRNQQLKDRQKELVIIIDQKKRLETALKAAEDTNKKLDVANRTKQKQVEDFEQRLLRQQQLIKDLQAVNLQVPGKSRNQQLREARDSFDAVIKELEEANANISGEQLANKGLLKEFIELTGLSAKAHERVQDLEAKLSTLSTTQARVRDLTNEKSKLETLLSAAESAIKREKRNSETALKTLQDANMILKASMEDRIREAVQKQQDVSNELVNELEAKMTLLETQNLDLRNSTDSELRQANALIESFKRLAGVGTKIRQRVIELQRPAQMRNKNIIRVGDHVAHFGDAEADGVWLEDNVENRQLW